MDSMLVPLKVGRAVPVRLRAFTRICTAEEEGAGGSKVGFFWARREKPTTRERQQRMVFLMYSVLGYAMFVLMRLAQFNDKEGIGFENYLDVVVLNLQRDFRINVGIVRKVAGHLGVSAVQDDFHPFDEA